MRAGHSFLICAVLCTSGTVAIAQLPPWPAVKGPPLRVERMTDTAQSAQGTRSIKIYPRYARSADIAPPQLLLAEPLPGLRIAFQLEPLGAVFAVTASGLWIVNTLFSVGYMRARREAHQPRFYACFALAMFGVMGIAMAANLVTPRSRVLGIC